MHIWPIHFAAHLTLTHHCKSLLSNKPYNKNKNTRKLGLPIVEEFLMLLKRERMYTSSRNLKMQILVQQV